ncbi:MAG TPA: hypothetical protein VEV41_07225 [Terriglobales bacterium]|nr:hypothetical protein [Terriglobales bacterium]
MAQGTCVLTSDPATKTVKLTGNCGAIAAVKAQAGYSVDNNNQAQPTPPATPAEPPKLEDMSAVPPIVTYQNGELTIVARNSTLSDILEAVRSKTGTDFEIPEGASEERVVSQIGPGPARDVLASLLNGSHFNYVMLGTEADPNAFAQLVLTPKPATATTATAASSPAPPHTTQPVQSLAFTPNAAAAATASTESRAASQPGQLSVLLPKTSAATNPSTEGDPPPQTASRALLQQLIPRTLPVWELQQAQQQQAQQQEPEQQESTDPAVAKETGTPDAAAAAQAASGSNASAPEPVTTSDAQQPLNSNPPEAQTNPPEAQTPAQLLQGMYGARRAMMEQQRKGPGR